ncbi:MAG: adenine phosphoribosyltransferase [Actinomycetota bacterium]
MSSSERIADLIASRIQDVPNFPRPGVTFKDIAPLLSDGSALGAVIDQWVNQYTGRVDVVAGIEARGFIMAAPVAVGLGVGFVPLRKAGKLPGPTHRLSYDLEYGSATVEIGRNAVAGQRVLLIDDVLATGGTARAGWDLLEHAGGAVVELAVLIELSFLAGRDALAGRSVCSALTI